ncbi:cyclopropane-fatty-acyl-phospholipid synthase [Formosimonas limnophila]|uniref:Cyclopropane-fatty-acyl-phospholipid synthase n=1 Tax=Formosimonas limnophila TaxID=1384487 RepID=A0A8J3G0E3_9BURK|nr:cyclopropane-fatty-acyl-phospholipid synthase family protein [Formosimonas limnophila]GHA68891.1 cyclopropane-fatty-acyl-phospholipid synthase [Formosimonas limnophila]
MSSSQPLSQQKSSTTHRWYRAAVLKQLKSLTHGSLTVVCDGEHHQFGQLNDLLHAELVVTDARAWPLLALQGSIGAGQAYALGYWHSEHLTSVVRILARNIDLLDQLDNRWASLGQGLLKLVHAFNRNTRKGSRSNIAAHYDLGNTLFEKFLDPSMMYSSAQFLKSNDTLEQAQYNKLKRICQKLDLKPSDHLLEIGTGWGSMAIYAAQHYGCRVTTTTLSQEQYNHTKARVESLGLSDKITLLMQDYRDLEGCYDKLVSIEMIEAVGHAYLETYFKKCAHLLKDDGLMLLQAITIRDQRYEAARNSVDFIQRYIFPGGALPSLQKILNIISDKTDMNLIHQEDFGAHYAQTLHLWHQNFKSARHELAQKGYDDYFYHQWEFYFCYCEGGFLERTIGCSQLLLAKPNARRAPVIHTLDS